MTFQDVCQSSVLGLVLEKGTRRVVTVMPRSPASRPLSGQAINEGDELLAVNGTQYVPGLHSRELISGAVRGPLSTGGVGGSADEMREHLGQGGRVREVCNKLRDRNSCCNSVGKILPDTEGRLVLRVQRISSEREEQVVCHLHKTLLETAEDEMAAVLEGAQANVNVSPILIGKLQKAANNLVSAASTVEVQARTALKESIVKARECAARMQVSSACVCSTHAGLFCMLRALVHLLYQVLKLLYRGFLRMCGLCELARHTCRSLSRLC